MLTGMWKMHARYTQHGSGIRLQYDLHNGNALVYPGVFVWDCTTLSDALLIERYIEKQGIESLEALREKAEMSSTKVWANRPWKRSVDRCLYELLVEQLVEGEESPSPKKE